MTFVDIPNKLNVGMLNGGIVVFKCYITFRKFDLNNNEEFTVLFP